MRKTGLKSSPKNKRYPLKISWSNIVRFFVPRWLSLILTMAISASALAGSPLDVVLTGVQHERGQLRVGLYADAKTFRKEAQALAIVTAPAQAGIVTLRFADLAPGRYAVMAYHDEDGNGELNRRFGMFPTEAYGLSNNPQVSGPPAFEDSAFAVPTAENRLQIELRY